MPEPGFVDCLWASTLMVILFVAVVGAANWNKYWAQQEANAPKWSQNERSAAGLDNLEPEYQNKRSAYQNGLNREE